MNARILNVVKIEGKPLCQELFRGSMLFNLKASHGLPLAMSIAQIIDDGKLIEWASFINEARKNQWWDFQIIKEVEEAMQDAGLKRDYQQGVLARFRLYMLKNPIILK